MRSLLILCLVIVLSAFACSANAADNNQVAPATLQAMGLNNMPVVSDARGDAIRGKGVLLIQAAYASNCFSTAASGTLYASKCCPVKLNANSGASVFGASASSSLCVVNGSCRR